MLAKKNGNRSTSRPLGQDRHERGKDGVLSNRSHPRPLREHEQQEGRTLRVGDGVEVWSHTIGTWLNGEVDEIVSRQRVHIRFTLEGMVYGKTVCTHSQDLRAPGICGGPNEVLNVECDPEFFLSEELLKDENRRPRRMKFLAEEAKDGSQMANNKLRAALKDCPSDLVKLDLPPPLAKPDFLTKVEDITEDMKHLQQTEPTKWAMTLKQWNQFINACKETSLWQEIKDHKGKDGYVSLFDMVTHFVIPWTQGTGCSIAVLMNKGASEASLMLSHTWAEDMEECQQAVNDHCGHNEIKDDTPVWFCGFALYQADGDAIIQKQLDLNPFTKVIESDMVKNNGMAAVHTTRAEIYDRLWCVREVAESLKKGVKTVAALSCQYAEKVKQQYTMVIDAGGTDQEAMEKAGLTVHAARAKCGREEDEKILLGELNSQQISLESIDKAVTSFRRKEMLHILDEAILAVAMKGRPDALITYAKQGNLQAVDMLYEVAEKGGPNARNGLFVKLKDIAESLSSFWSRYWSTKFTSPFEKINYNELSTQQRNVLKNQALGFVVALLQAMSSDHEESLKLRLGIEPLYFNDTSKVHLDDPELLRQLCYCQVQTLLNQGNHKLVVDILFLELQEQNKNRSKEPTHRTKSVTRIDPDSDDHAIVREYVVWDPSRKRWLPTGEAERQGTIVAWDKAQGRWKVRMVDGSGKMFKPANLEATNMHTELHEGQSAETVQTICPGQQVHICSLKARLDLNGLEGTVEQWDQNEKRWKVIMADGTGKMLKPQNLEITLSGRGIKLAIEPLAQKWNRQTLLALKELANDGEQNAELKKWAQLLLEQSKRSLQVGWSRD